MGAEIDRLEVEVEASAAKANAELNKLINRLDKVANSISGINANGLTGFANGIEKLGKAMQSVNTVKTADFTRLVKNIEKVSAADSAGLVKTASAIGSVARSLTSTGAAMKSSENIVTLAGNLGKLGGANIQKAITNLPQLASELKKLMTTLSQSPNVSKNVIQMTNALANLSNSLKGVQTGSVGSSVGKSTSNIQKLSAAFSQLSGKVTKTNKSMKSFSQLAGKIYANCFMLIRGIKKLGNAIETAMDYVETYNYFAVTMDKIGTEFSGMYEQYGYDSAEAYANSFSGRLNELTRKMTGYSVGSNGELTLTDSIGLALDPEAIMNYQSSIAAVTNSVGLLGENSVNVSKALTMLSADMSSLKNVDLSTAMTNFQSGLIGQSRALYKYGIDITNNTLQTYAYSLGLEKAVAEMTQAEKMQLRMIAILDQSKVAWADQANTINSVANQYRIMKQQLSNLARVLGNLFLPIVQKVLPVVNGLIIALQRLFTALGFKLWGGNWLKDTMDGISGGYADDSLDDLVDDADDTADSLSDAANAAQKLKTTVLGIDELNINAPEDSASALEVGTSAGDMIDLSGAIADMVSDYESIWDEAFANSVNKAQEYADAICAVFTSIWKAIEPFREAVSRLWNEGLSLLMGYTFQNLRDFYSEFLVPLGMWAFGTEGAGLTRLVDVINNQLMRVDWVWISDNLREFWRAIEPYAEQFGEGLIDFFEDISGIAVDVINKIFGRDGAITDITNWLNNNDPEKARSWGYALGELAVGFFALKGVGAIITGLASIGTTLTGIATGLSALFGAEGILVKMGSAISGLFASNGIFGSSGMIIKALEGIQAVISTLTGGAVAVPLGGIAAAIAAVVFALVDLWKTSEKFRDAVKTAFGQVTEALGTAFSSWNEGISTVVDRLMTLLGTLYEIYENSPLKDLVELIGIIAVKLAGALASGLLTAIGNAFLGFCDILSSVISIVTGLLEVIAGLANFDGEMIITGFRDIGNGIQDVFTGLFEYISALPNEFLKIGENIISGLWQGIQNTWNNVKTGIKDFCSGFVNSFKEALDIHSPSGKMEDIGDYSVLGLIKPFESTEALGAIRTFAESMINMISQILSPEQFMLIGQNAVNALMSAFSLEVMQLAFSNINLAFQNVWAELMIWWQEIAMPTWINEGVLPWFSQEIWLENTDGMKLGILAKWKEFSTLWKTNIQKWWNSDVTTWFTVVKWGAFGENMKNGIYSGFKGIVQMIGNVVNGMIDVFNAGLAQIQNAMNALISDFNKIASELGVSKLPKVHAQNIAHVKIPAFAEGGYPNTGELFLARENGINEMVGHIGSRPAVANNDQIVEAIRVAVAQSFNADEQNELLREQNSLLRALLEKDTDVTLDGRSLVNGIDKARQRMGWSF